MKSLIILSLFFALAFTLETNTFLSADPKLKPAAPQSSNLAQLQKLVSDNKGSALCLLSSNQIIAKDSQVLAKLKAKGPASLKFIECHEFLSNHAKAAAAKTKVEAVKEAKKAPKAKPSGGLLSKLKKVASEVKKSIATVAGKALKAATAAAASKAIDFLVKKAPVSKETAAKLAKVLDQKAKLVQNAASKLAKKVEAKAKGKAPAQVQKAVSTGQANKCWAEASKLIDNSKCQLK